MKCFLGDCLRLADFFALVSVRKGRVSESSVLGGIV